MRGNNIRKTVTIASGAAITSEVVIDGYELVAIGMPAAWTAATLSFQAIGGKGDTYVEAVKGGSALSETVAASQYIILTTPIVGYGVKVRSGTSGTPVNQLADRELELVLKPFV